MDSRLVLIGVHMDKVELRVARAIVAAAAAAAAAAISREAKRTRWRPYNCNSNHAGAGSYRIIPLELYPICESRQQAGHTPSSSRPPAGGRGLPEPPLLSLDSSPPNSSSSLAFRCPAARKEVSWLSLTLSRTLKEGAPVLELWRTALVDILPVATRPGVVWCGLSVRCCCATTSVLRSSLS